MCAKNIVVISDVHLSNDAAYSWFRAERAEERIVALLNEIAALPDVSELVLLGDVFDLWLYPVDVQPWTFFEILAKWPNVIAALENCVATLPNVYYINGNHDISVTREDIEKIGKNGKTVQWVTPEEYEEKHFDGGVKWLHLEHGHNADICNAKPPADATDTIGGLPFGYFVTRLVATSDDEDTAKNAVMKSIEGVLALASTAPSTEMLVADKTIGELVGKKLVHAVIDALMFVISEKRKDFHVDNSTPIVMPAGIDAVTIADVKNSYHSILAPWIQKLGKDGFGLNELVKAALVSVDPNGLDWYSNNLFTKYPSVKVIAMGHTHSAKNVDEKYCNDGCSYRNPFNYAFIDTIQRRVFLKSENG